MFWNIIHCPKSEYFWLLKLIQCRCWRIWEPQALKCRVHKNKIATLHSKYLFEAKKLWKVQLNNYHFMRVNMMCAIWGLSPMKTLKVFGCALHRWGITPTKGHLWLQQGPMERMKPIHIHEFRDIVGPVSTAVHREAGHFDGHLSTHAHQTPNWWHLRNSTANMQ